MALDNVYIFFLLSVFFLFLLTRNFFFINNELYLDKEFSKPQAFHQVPIPRVGGFIIFIITIFYLLFYFGEKSFSYSTILLGIIFFIVGFFDDFKLKIKPELRLFIMFLFSFWIIYLLEINIYYTQLKFLDNLINYNKITLALFACCCLLFIVNGSNFIDGLNGLLTIQYLIILIFLYLLIHKVNNVLYLKSYIALSISLGFSFLIFNFPKAKIFLGNAGAYFFGSNLSLIIIEIHKHGNYHEFPPFLFACLLFYIFFEVFFSFFRKIIFKKKSPLKPDTEHLHMLLFYFINKKIKNLGKSNYVTALVINVIYLFLITPLFFIYNNSQFCKIYFIFLLLFYLFFYLLLLFSRRSY
jgi:UDP-N-acetylmuramyl pentapeptide phosphotransferase/UDP-N-acetylglucosamine-1-phosphate transferase